MPWWKGKEKVIIPRRRKPKKKSCSEKYGPQACCIKLHNCWSHCRICCRQGCKRIKNLLCPGKKYVQTNSALLFQRSSKYSLTALSGEIKLLKDAGIKDIKATLHLSKSKEKILDNMVKDYGKNAKKEAKKGDIGDNKDEETKGSIKAMDKKLSNAGNLREMNKQQVETLLDDYVRRKKIKKTLGKKKRVLYQKSNEKSTLKKKKHIKLNLMLKHHKSGKFTAAGLPVDAKGTKAKLKRMLDKEEKMKQRGVSFAAMTRVRQVENYLPPQ